MADFSIYYIEANVVCMLIFGIMLFHNHFSIDRQEKQMKFDRVLAAFILYFFTDCLWAAIATGKIAKTRASVSANGFLIYILMGATLYFWLEYVKAYEKIPSRNDPLSRFAVLFPFGLSTAALVVNYLVAPETLIDSQQNTTGLYSVYLTVVPDIYMAAVLFFTVKKARQEEDRMERRKLMFIGLFPLVGTVGGFVETVFFPEVPIYCFACLIMMLVFYIQSVMGQVSTDPLTGLNNRGQLRRYAAQKANLMPAGRHTAVVMMDVDNFKAINDTYGHAEGDKALVAMADAMRKAAAEHDLPAFLGRYGGDEFIMILHPRALEEAEQMIEEIRRETKAHSFTVSAGCDEVRGEGDSIESCIQRADHKLYMEKERHRVRRHTPAARML